MIRRDCTDCPTEGRRDFLRAAASFLATLAALGVPPAAAEAFTVRGGRALAVLGTDATYPIPAADGATIDKEQQVILVRWQGVVYAFNLSCPHQNTALKWIAEDQRFQCPKHKSRYQPDGTFISGRATRGMDRLAIRREGETMVVNLDAMFEQDKDPAGWTAAKVTLS
ncbi:MAG TPA: Rieske (2Fe-2S) protein [Gemmatimonadales bacterium]|nr:Rieske (2Fe-2S) protein [Gemmatimonadales bacterium]